MKRFAWTAVVGLCTLVGTASAQTSQPGSDAGEQDPLVQRIRQLEEESAAMRSELDRWRENPGLQEDFSAAFVSVPVPAMEADYEGEYDTRENLLQNFRDLVWTKGDYRIVPYGNLWGSAIYDTQRTYPGPWTFYVLSGEQSGEEQFLIDTRRTRLGLDVTGPQIPTFHNANSRGRVEIDFHGSFVGEGVFVDENRPGILLRHAYAEVYDDDFRLMAGQTWDLISPLLPRTVSYSVGWAGGNIGFRRMQVRYERYLNFSDAFRVTPALAMSQNVITDDPTEREPTGWPIVQGRLGFEIGPRDGGAKPLAFGVSGHIGEQGFDFRSPPVQEDARVRTWSFNSDVSVPITDRLSLQGEFFTGSDLRTFLGGINQGVNLVQRDGIQSTGGWMDLGYEWTKKFHTNGGFGIDDPRNGDIAPGGRTYNRFVFVNGMYDMTQKLKFGLEITSWKTNWSDLEPGNAVRIEIDGGYSF